MTPGYSKRPRRHLIEVNGDERNGGRNRAFWHVRQRTATGDGVAMEQRLVLAQIATDAKSNEITAVPKLLAMLSLKGTIVTADALNCQRAIAQQIVEQGGDYALALKGNQGTLHDDVVRFLHDPAGRRITGNPQVDADHGRIETRTATVSTDIAWLQDAPSLARLAGHRQGGPNRETPARTTIETAYYLLSTVLSVERFNEVTRQHWGIETHDARGLSSFRACLRSRSPPTLC